MALKGLIVYFDGPDGVGKTTQLELAAAALRQAGHQVEVKHALGGSEIGEKLRQAMMSDDERPAETDLYIALACYYAMLKDILARRNEQQIVLIDRSPLSIIGYQVFGEGIDAEKGYRVAAEALEAVKPDLIVAYMAADQTLQARREQRNHTKGVDFFEKKPVTFHQDVTRGYGEAISRFGAVSIDAEQSVEAVHEATMQRINALLTA